MSLKEPTTNFHGSDAVLFSSVVLVKTGSFGKEK